MNAALSTLVGILTLAMTAFAQTWNLVWSDEFTGPSINTSNWTYDIGGSGWGKSELQYYTNRSVNAAIDNGALLIVAKQNRSAGIATPLLG